MGKYTQPSEGYKQHPTLCSAILCTNLATGWCVDCSQHLCLECSRIDDSTDHILCASCLDHRVIVNHVNQACGIREYRMRENNTEEKEKKMAHVVRSKDKFESMQFAVDNVAEIAKWTNYKVVLFDNDLDNITLRVHTPDNEDDDYDICSLGSWIVTSEDEYFSVWSDEEYQKEFENVGGE